MKIIDCINVMIDACGRTIARKDDFLLYFKKQPSFLPIEQINIKNRPPMYIRSKNLSFGKNGSPAATGVSNVGKDNDIQPEINAFRLFHRLHFAHAAT